MIPQGAEFYFLGKAPAAIGTQAFSTGNGNNPCVFYAARNMDEEGWASWTTELTDSDRAKASFPETGTFGVLVNSGYRHWLVH